MLINTNTSLLIFFENSSPIALIPHVAQELHTLYRKKLQPLRVFRSYKSKTSPTPTVVFIPLIYPKTSSQTLFLYTYNPNK